MCEPFRCKIASHLCFWMLARGDTTVNLQRRYVADRQQAVGLFGGQPIDLCIESCFERTASGFGRLEAHYPIVASKLFAQR